MRHAARPPGGVICFLSSRVLQCPGATTRMKTILRILALLVLLAGLGFWLSAGRHTGWSQNQVPVKKKDPITEIEFEEYEKRYVPGVDFLAGVFGAAGALLTAAFFARKK
jgi:hypothetical protein